MNEFRNITMKKLSTLGSVDLVLELYETTPEAGADWLLKVFLNYPNGQRVKQDPEQMWRLTRNQNGFITFILPERM